MFVEIWELWLFAGALILFGAGITYAILESRMKKMMWLLKRAELALRVAKFILEGIERGDDV